MNFQEHQISDLKNRIKFLEESYTHMSNEIKYNKQILDIHQGTHGFHIDILKKLVEKMNSLEEAVIRLIENKIGDDL
jgi:hypothetical protein